MTARHPVTTPLAERMAKHKPGQITWPEPALGRWCSQCRFYYTGDTANVSKGRCDLVQAHSNGGVKGMAFEGENAIACPQFDAGVHELNGKDK